MILVIMDYCCVLLVRGAKSSSMKTGALKVEEGFGYFSVFSSTLSDFCFYSLISLLKNYLSTFFYSSSIRSKRSICSLTVCLELIEGISMFAELSLFRFFLPFLPLG